MKPITTKTTQLGTTTNEEATMKKKTAKKNVKPTTNESEDTMNQKAKKTAVQTQDVGVAATIDGPPATSNGPPVTPSLGAVSAQLQALEQSCGYGDPLPDAARKASDDLVRRIPSTIVARVIALAARGGGTVAGIAFDPDAAKTALAQADEADAVATAAQMLARRAQDHASRLRSGVAGNTSAIRTALRGYVKTEQGAPLAQEADEIRSLAKQHVAARKARKTREAKAVTDALAKAPPGATPAPETAPAPAGASSMTPPPTPKAS